MKKNAIRPFGMQMLTPLSTDDLEKLNGGRRHHKHHPTSGGGTGGGAVTCMAISLPSSAFPSGDHS